MAQREVVVKIDSDRDQETGGLSQINTDVSAKEAQNSPENGTGRVLPRDTEIGDQGNSQLTSRSVDRACQYHKVGVCKVKQRGKVSKLTIFQLVILALTVAALLCSLVISEFKGPKLCDLPLWKWALMALVLISGRLVSGWIVRVVVYFMEQNYILRKRVLYFVYVLRGCVRNCLWLSIVLAVWILGIDRTLERESQNGALPYITKILVCLIVSYFIWLLKILLVKVLVMSFHIKAFFEQLRKALFNQYVIKKLSLPPLNKRKRLSMRRVNECFMFGNSGGFCKQLSGMEDEAMSMSGLLDEDKKNVSAWIMKRMKRSIRRRDFLILDTDSDTINDSQKEIKTEEEAKKAANSIFRHVIESSSRNDGLILLEDVKKYMPEAEAKKAMQILQEPDKDEGVDLSSFCDWMVGASRERKALSSSLSDTKSAVNDLRTKFNIFTVFVIIIFWFVILGLRAPNFLVYMGAQLIVLAFIFGNTCKTVFEGCVFLFVIHPFDVGDLCEVDGVQMVVKKMKILTTVFIRDDNQKIMFPNSVLATKPITNYHRSKNVREVVDIVVDGSSPNAKLESLKEKIQSYAEEGKGEREHMAVKMVAKDMAENNKVKMSVWMEHKMKNQNMEERSEKRPTLIKAISQAIKDHHL